MKPNVQTCGVTNETEDGFFVPVMDYDNVAYARVKKDLRHLNSVFGLCTFAVLGNSEMTILDNMGKPEKVGHYNVIGLDRLDFHKCEEALHHTRCDAAFLGHIAHYPQRNHVIRILEKVDVKNLEEVRPAPKLLEIVKMPCSGHSHSQAHKEMLERYFGARFGHISRLDGLKVVEMVHYRTQRKDLKKKRR